jgi:hypothetical protein
VASVPASSGDKEEVAFAPYGPGVAARFPPPRLRYLTPGLQPGRNSYTSDAEIHGLLESLAAAAGTHGTTARAFEYGRSQNGTPLSALLLTRQADVAPALLARYGRPVVMLIGQQHGDEPAPAEAMLVIAQELARGRLASLLDRINVLIVPRANPDGGAVAKRVMADGVDLNRDHLLLRSPEARGLAALAANYRPALVVDAHEYSVIGRYLDKFDAVQRYDALTQYATVANLPSALAQVSEAWFRKPMVDALEGESLSVEWYYTTSTKLDDKRISMGGVRPDTGRNVNGLKNAVSFLVETRGIGLGRVHLMRRVHTHVVAAESLLKSAAQQAEALVRLREQLDVEISALACRGQFVVDAAPTLTRRKLKMLDPDSGADKELDVEWNSALELKVMKTRNRPCGYWLSGDSGEAVQRLRQLGVEVQRLTDGAELKAERWRETARNEGARADVRGTVADAGATVLHVDVSLEPQTLRVPEGSYYVPLGQPLAHLVTAALEPDTQDSYFANRLLGSLDQAARVVVPPALRIEGVTRGE